MGAIMTVFDEPPEVEVRRNIRELAHNRVEGDELKASPEELAALLRHMSDAPIREIEKLINQLQKLRTRLQDASNRIQGDIEDYTELSQQTMQLASIIVDSVTKLPSGADR
jgi:predicted transcriptional regulator